MTASWAAATGFVTFPTTLRPRMADAATMPPNIAPVTPSSATSDPVRNRFGTGVCALNDRSRKRARFQHQRQIMCRVLAEIAFDHAGIIDAAVDGWGGIHAVVEHDGHLPTKILLREGPEAVRRIAGERKIDDPLAGVVGVAIFRGAAKVAAGDHRRAGKDVPPFTIRWRAGNGARFRTTGD